MPATMRDKALLALSADRVRVVKASPCGIALHVTASKPDKDTLKTRVYLTLVYVLAGEVVRRCSCPSPKGCYHLTAAEMLWRPEEK
jgi:hypothetical protein